METNRRVFKFKYDYTKCMMMKLFLAKPDRNGGSEVAVDFADALEIIKKVDAVTAGMPKIIYLVGWQYNGHDDKYPDFFEVNDALKRDGETALESMLWLINEAKKYHTAVSVHINFNDAYKNAPSFERFKKANALICDKNGNPAVVEQYNGLDCYKTSFVQYYESGLFKEFFDRLLSILPIQEAGTVHVDNFQCYRNFSPAVSIKEMQDARCKMIEYVNSKGVDITSEFTYREYSKIPNKPPFKMRGSLHSLNAPIDTLGIIPASWWCSNLKRKEYVEIPPQLYCGGCYSSKHYSNFLYGNIHGEDVFMKYNDKRSNWLDEFIYQFASVQVPFQFLCNFKRLSINGIGFNDSCIHQNGVVSYNRNRKITVNGKTVKEKDNLLLPLSHLEDTYIAYSKNGCERVWNLTNGGYKTAKLFSFNGDEYIFVCDKKIVNNKLQLNLSPKNLMMIKFAK